MKPGSERRGGAGNGLPEHFKRVVEMLGSRYKSLRLRFESHPQQNVPLVIYNRGVVLAFAEIQLKPRALRAAPYPTPDRVIFDRLTLARERMEKKYLAENRGEMPHPAQIWMIVWAKDGLWGSNIEYLYPEGPWPQVLELGYFKQLGREKYVSEEAVALDAARKSDKSLSGTLLPSDESRVARGAGFFGD